MNVAQGVSTGARKIIFVRTQLIERETVSSIHSPRFALLRKFVGVNSYSRCDDKPMSLGRQRSEGPHRESE
jgi:hypothetical protein